MVFVIAVINPVKILSGFKKKKKSKQVEWEYESKSQWCEKLMWGSCGWLIANVAGARAQLKCNLKFIFSYSTGDPSLYTRAGECELVTWSGRSSSGWSPRLGVAWQASLFWNRLVLLPDLVVQLGACIPPQHWKQLCLWSTAALTLGTCLACSWRNAWNLPSLMKRKPWQCGYVVGKLKTG